MKKNKDNFLKLITVIFFLGFIFLIPVVTLTTKDKKINEIENKILTQLPKFSLQKVFAGSFMKDFDNYTSDQFPLRSQFIQLKNSFNYTLGHREFRDVYIGDNGHLMEKFIFDKNVVDKNISQVIRLSRHFKDSYGISSKLMVIPTSIAFYENELPKTAITDSQINVLNYVESKLKNNNNDSSLSFYTPYKVLEKHKDEYIYFNTDHHWTQLGAKIAYDDMFGSIDKESKYTKVSDDFYGTYFSKALFPNIKGDSIYAYEDYNNFSIVVDLDKTFDTLYDESRLSGKNKYQYFLHGDPAIAVIEGNSSIDNEILIFKDSFAHNFVPFLTNNYSKIHIIDPRYYKVYIDEYLNENKKIKEILFLSNISTLNSSLLFK